MRLPWITVGLVLCATLTIVGVLVASMPTSGLLGLGACAALLLLMLD